MPLMIKALLLALCALLSVTSTAAAFLPGSPFLGLVCLLGQLTAICATVHIVTR